LVINLERAERLQPEDKLFNFLHANARGNPR
jgi:hypothetical protein